MENPQKPHFNSKGQGFLTFEVIYYGLSLSIMDLVVQCYFGSKTFSLTDPDIH